MIIEGKNLLAAGLVILSTSILFNKLMLPTTIQIIVQNGSIMLEEIPNVYTIKDCIVIAVSSFFLGMSILYLLFIKSGYDLQLKSPINQALLGNATAYSPVLGSNPGLESEDKANIENILNIFKGNEQRIIKELLYTKEMTQAELASRADIPKSTLSRTLADLEKRSVIIRYENGMSKMVKLADALQK